MSALLPVVSHAPACALRLACRTLARKTTKNPVQAARHRLRASTFVLANPFVIARRGWKPDALLFAATDPRADLVDVGNRRLASLLSDSDKRRRTPTRVTVCTRGNPHVLRESVDNTAPHVARIRRKLILAPDRGIAPSGDGDGDILTVNRVRRKRAPRHRPHDPECREQLVGGTANCRSILDLANSAR